MASASIIYDDIHKDCFFYEEKRGKEFYEEQAEKCEKFINASRKEQELLGKEIEELLKTYHSKQQQYNQLQQRKELIKERLKEFNDYIDHYSGDERTAKE
ncbi:hypothetical protein EHI8A_196800 [Entamoeba histolytica HM-1:IMSS-B]|uniref:Uncharacterized protein n=2 Tax=Entamoeba histolytica (strain ATCC 30459 / HM-1:IMSS / ABRM) TaxID=294381 RepID=M3TZZ4_ENTH1|nr:hypothetical protein EHI8A_196800 [Entamoeba histolytica HM-1:IMSS-B]ENY63298.1 unknown protein, putative [Entamoeba histolytica HM-1:IMSS-A]